MIAPATPPDAALSVRHTPLGVEPRSVGLYLGRRRVGHPLVVTAYAALAMASLVVYVLVGGVTAAIAYVAASALPVVGVIAGTRIFRPRFVLPWYLIAAGQASFLLGDLLWYATETSGTAATYPSVADVAYLIAYPLLAAGIWLFVRHRLPGGRLASFVEGLSIGTAGVLALWLIHVEPFIHDPALPVVEKAVLLAYPIGDALLLGAAIYLLLAARRTGTSVRLIVASLGVLLVADVGYAALQASDAYVQSAFDSLWILSYALIGLAALLPSMRTLTEPEATGGIRHQRRHSAVLATALGVVPVTAAIQQLTVGHVDWAVFATAEIVLIGLLLTSVFERERSTAAAERQLRRSHALLEATEELAGVASWEWDARTASPYWSKEMWRQLGLDRATTALDNTTILRAVHPDDVERVVAATTASFRNGIPLDVGYRVVRPDGSVRHVHAVGRVEVDDDGRPLRVIGANLDVTERHLARERLEFQADVLANVQESIIATDLEGRVTYWSNGAAKLFGYTADEMVGQSLARLYPAESPALEQDIATILAGGDALTEWEGRRADGTAVWLQVHTSVVRDRTGRPAALLGVAMDITERRAANARLVRLATAIEQSSESVVIANTKGEIEYVNPAFERVTGYGRDEVLGQNPRLLKSGFQSEAFYDAMWAMLAAGQSWTADFINRRKDGTLFNEEGVITPIRDEHGAVSGYVAVKRDVTEQRRTEERAARLARERSLIAQTIRGLDGRDTPEGTAAALCQQVASLTDVSTAGLFVFELNGRATPYGFIIAGGGPGPMRRVPRGRTEYLLSQARRGPWIEAWENRPQHPYNRTFQDLGIRAIAYAPIRDGDETVGFLHISSAVPDAEDRLADALSALVEFADIAGALLGPRIAARTAVESVRHEITRIVRSKAFETVFQPIVDIHRDEVVGYEALTRFDDGEAPDVRFAEAARVGMAAELEIETIRSALRSTPSLPADTWLNINVSPQLLIDSQRLREVLASARSPVVVEVTEHAAISNYARFREAVERLGPHVRIAVDDAGAGFASLRHIIELRPAIVKLDRALIAGLDTDDAKQALVAGMCQFARSTGVDLVAEGVETREELATLRRLDVRLAQGYWLGRPGPIADAGGRA